MAQVQGVVIKLDRGYPLVRLDTGEEVRCEHAISLVKGGEHRAVVGDKVVVSLPEGHDKGLIEEVLPRTSAFVRKDPTERALPQTLAANFDVVLVAQPIEEINERRLERELVLAHETGVSVAVVLTKADLMVSPDEIAAVRRRIDGFIGANDTLVVVSEKDPASIKALSDVIDHKTAVLIGRSGVGKSSEIIELPSGGCIIDMPGVRGLGLWDADEGIGAAFADIEQLASECKFRDCTHTNEPGCAVRKAVEAGEISPARLESYIRLRNESKQVKQRREEAQRIRTRRGHPRRRK